MLLATQLAGPLGRPRRVVPDPPTTGGVVLLTLIAVFIGTGAFIGLRAAWTTPPEQLDAQPGRHRMRAGLAGLPMLVAMPATVLYVLIVRTAGYDDGIVQLLLSVIALGGLALSGIYGLAYYWVRFPDWLLPPPQRGRGGQWNDPDGRPAR